MSLLSNYSLIIIILIFFIVSIQRYNYMSTKYQQTIDHALEKYTYAPKVPLFPRKCHGNTHAAYYGFEWGGGGFMVLPQFRPCKLKSSASRLYTHFHFQSVAFIFSLHSLRTDLLTETGPHHRFTVQHQTVWKRWSLLHREFYRRNKGL